MKVSLPDKLMYHAYIIQAAALVAEEHYLSQNGRKTVMQRGKIAWKHVHRSVAKIHHCLEPIYFCRAYWMSYYSFWCLHEKLEGKIEDVASKVRGYSPKEANGEKRSVPPIPNGIISSSVRLAIAI
jgi:hypothetical protein